MRVRVKICGVSTPDIVDAAVDAGADAIGLVFADSPRQVNEDTAKSLMQRLPPWVASVAVTRHPDDDFSYLLSRLSPAWWQSDRSDLVHVVLPPGLRTLAVIREGEDTDSLPDWFVYEGRQSGQGETVDWQQAAELARRGRMILAGGLDASNVATAIRQVRPYAVDVSSGVESEPGQKDAQKIYEFVAAVRLAEQELQST